MPVILVTDSGEDWIGELEGVERVDAHDYLTDPDWHRRRGLKVYNLCRSYAYQSLGYYVSLLAEARGHRPVPSVMTIQDFQRHVAAHHFRNGSPPRTKRNVTRFDLAILHNPAEGNLAPSDEPALRRLIKAAAAVGIHARLITHQDAARLLEFDALFIRETTAVNHHTYRLARRAQHEGLVVIDDPLSILRCTNKVFLAELLQKNKIPTPNTVVAHRGNADRLAETLGFPLVLKRPDSAFSLGVVKVDGEEALKKHLKAMFAESELVIAQQYMRTDYDWRIGILDGRGLYACKYHMAAGHWQIAKHVEGKSTRWGKCETMPIELAPRKAITIALKSAELIGDGLYGVDVKESDGQFYVIEVNDNPNLDAMGLALLPAGMHPWMDPAVETELWPGEGQEIYQTYDRIFDCRRHGWANVQSVHLNLPFAGDDQFRRLHAAVRLVLPLLPALAASSPVTDGRPRDTLDTRVVHYARHCDEIPEMIGDVIPEAVDGEADYRRQILDPIAAAVGPRDPGGSMRVEFLNARGAIARFDRGSIEIRLMDVQEYPAADLAICAAAVAAIRRLADETWSSFAEQQAVPTATLRRLLDATAADAEQTPIDDEGYLRVLGIDDVPSRGSMPIRASDVWRSLLERGAPEDASLAEFAEPLGVILDRGPLARRIRQRLGSRFTREHLAATYRDVAECLDTWHPFRP